MIALFASRAVSARWRNCSQPFGDRGWSLSSAANRKSHFKHALVQDAAYHSLLRANRSVQRRRVAESLEKLFPETAGKQPELLAYHYTEAGLAQPAITYWRTAGQRSAKHAANIEAIDHLRRGFGGAGNPAGPRGARRRGADHTARAGPGPDVDENDRGTKAGTLDDTSWVDPTVQFWCASAQPWLSLPEKVQPFQKMPG